MQQAYRLQVDIPLWQVNTALTAMLRASQEMGGYVYDAPYRSFASAADNKRTCLAMVFDELPQNNWGWSWPLWDELQRANLADKAMVGWSYMYMVPQDTYFLRADSYQWFASLSWAVAYIVPTGNQGFLIRLRPNVLWITFHDAVCNYNEAQPRPQLHQKKEDNHFIKQIEDWQGVLVHNIQTERDATFALRKAHANNRFFDTYLKLDISGPWDCRRRGNYTAHFIQGAISFLQEHSFELLEREFTYEPCHNSDWYLLRFPNPVTAQAFYYVFENYEWDDMGAASSATIRLFNPTFANELRDPSVGARARLLGGEEGRRLFCPAMLRDIAPRNSRVYAVEDRAQP